MYNCLSVLYQAFNYLCFLPSSSSKHITNLCQRVPFSLCGQYGDWTFFFSICTLKLSVPSLSYITVPWVSFYLTLIKHGLILLISILSVTANVMLHHLNRHFVHHSVGSPFFTGWVNCFSILHNSFIVILTLPVNSCIERSASHFCCLMMSAFIIYFVLNFTSVFKQRS